MADLHSQRPYLIRAIYDWILDNDLTPHLLIATYAKDVVAPPGYASEDGKMTVNVSPSAVRNLILENDEIAFSARFSGQSFAVSVPPGAVLAIYARENGEGMLFGEIEEHLQPSAQTDDVEPATALSDEPPAKKSGHLRVVK